MFERIRNLREDRDIRQAQMAEFLQVHQTTYSDYELGNLNIPIDVLIKLAKFYGTSIDYLVGLTDNPTPYKWFNAPNNLLGAFFYIRADGTHFLLFIISSFLFKAAL